MNAVTASRLLRGLDRARAAAGSVPVPLRKGSSGPALPVLCQRPNAGGLSVPGRQGWLLAAMVTGHRGPEERRDRAAGPAAASWGPQGAVEEARSKLGLPWLCCRCIVPRWRKMTQEDALSFTIGPLFARPEHLARPGSWQGCTPGSCPRGAAATGRQGLSCG